LLASSATHAAALGCGIRGRSAPRRPGMRPPVVELHPVGLGSGCAVGGAPPLQPRRTQGPLPACRLPQPESSCSDGEVRRPRAQHAPHKWLWGGGVMAPGRIACRGERQPSPLATPPATSGASLSRHQGAPALTPVASKEREALMEQRS
jgi:hypothetical protein